MITEVKHKKITISEFKTHCTEYIRALENSDEIIEITRHGKVVAIAKKPDAPESSEPQTIGGSMGLLRGSVIFAEDYDPDEPTFSPEDWEDHPSNQRA